MGECDGPILYVIVVGFHHKKGCQVEFSFPPLVPNAPNECPPGWKYLPTLALPDGSHNFDEDTAFFHLPSLTDSKKSVYGISCYRQIPVERLKNVTADITRGTVQKSVCVLSKVPLYGYIQVKMALITHAYFEEGDFSKVSILEDTYHHLNSVLLQNDLSLQTFVGLSARDFILHWRHKAVLLFKLLLLEKRVVFYKSPVHSLCSTILTLLSLYPLMIERGLDESACVKLSRPMSPMPDFSEEDATNTNPIHIDSNSDSKNSTSEIPLNNSQLVPSCVDSNFNFDQTNGILNAEVGLEAIESSSQNDFNKSNSVKNSNSDAVGNIALPDIKILTPIEIEQCGVPLPLFSNGYLCLPYLSLPYLDLLTDVKVRGYVIGATNVLFKQKRQLSDILIDIENGKIECQDIELRKQLHLTTEDLRFADYIVKHVVDDRHDVFLDGVGWEGGDEWIRTQFQIYLLYLLKTATTDGNREQEFFNINYITALRETHNFNLWQSIQHPGMDIIDCKHPFAGQLSVSDMKLRFTHTMQNTESGRKLNQAMVSTGRAVATTSKAVGGALSQAKGAFSNWWSNLLVSPDIKVADLTNNEYDNQIAEGSNNLNNSEMISEHDEQDIVCTNTEHIIAHNVCISKSTMEKESNVRNVDKTPFEIGQVYTV